ncbi:hypothetical protein [Streptomyces calvus]|jgi:hypothetical protein|uniref:Uncharacterized protein n=1 Tax=Streptomyces calvus TaxID=67282 RepID=A0A514JLR7_9ACTN|nr:hypothetical protein [Streptomyces calvus]QDI68270.1 hypothetical protein CD934_06000 [Streptomyces calvus]
MSGAIRLTFEYRGHHIELVASERVDLVLPGGPGGQQGLSVGLAPARAAAQPDIAIGYRVDILNARGQRIHSRPLDNPIKEEAEVVSSDPDRPFTNQPVSQPKGRFFVLVPALAEAKEVALLRTTVRTQTIGRFPLGHGTEGGGS